MDNCEILYDLLPTNANWTITVDKIEVIYNPCDKEAIKNKISDDILTDSEKEIFENSENIVITAGRLTEQKGQWHLIRSFSKVVEEIPNAKLVILGEGDKKSYLKRKTQCMTRNLRHKSKW